MKILYIAHSGNIHGSGLALLNLISLLSEKCNIVVLLPHTGDMTKRLSEMKIKFYVTSYENATRPPVRGIKNLILCLPRLAKKYLTSWIAQNYLEKIIKKEKPDIIHTNTGVIHFGAKISRKYKIPHVWHIREFQKLDFGYTPLRGMENFNKKLWNKNNYCIAITKAVFNNFQLQKANACIVYDGVFSEEIPIVSPVEKKNYFLFTGALLKGKGVHNAIDAFEKLAKNQPDCELWIAGSGNSIYVEQLKQQVALSNYSQRIKFLGYRTDVYKLMSEATALLVPSIHEGFGFITAEAMLNKCLVIGNNTSGTKEQFDNGFQRHKQEIALRYSGQEELFETMKRVLDNGVEHYRPMIERAHETVRALYTTEQNAEKIYDYYLEVLENDGK